MVKTVFLTVDDDENVFEKWLDESDKKIIKFAHDPIACACASYQRWVETGHRWVDIETITPTEEAYAMAKALRDYYRGRHTWNALKGYEPANPTDFKRKLNSLINGNLDITKNELGLLYRLPYFYIEDTDIDDLIETTSDAQIKIQVVPNHINVQKEFTLHKRILRSRRASETIQFWLRADDKTPYVFVVDSKNPLLSLFESMLVNPVRLEANLYVKSHRGFHRDKLYYHIGGIKLI